LANAVAKYLFVECAGILDSKVDLGFDQGPFQIFGVTLTGVIFDQAVETLNVQVPSKGLQRTPAAAPRGTILNAAGQRDINFRSRGAGKKNH
jgi:hypothetical protein